MKWEGRDHGAGGKNLGAVSPRMGGKERSLGRYLEDDPADAIQDI